MPYLEENAWGSFMWMVLHVEVVLQWGAKDARIRTERERKRESEKERERECVRERGSETKTVGDGGKTHDQIWIKPRATQVVWLLAHFYSLLTIFFAVLTIQNSKDRFLPCHLFNV